MARGYTVGTCPRRISFEYMCMQHILLWFPAVWTGCASGTSQGKRGALRATWPPLQRSTIFAWTTGRSRSCGGRCMYLVTGGVGFIGSNIVAHLSDLGEEIVVCD